MATKSPRVNATELNTLSREALISEIERLQIEKQRLEERVDYLELRPASPPLVDDLHHSPPDSLSFPPQLNTLIINELPDFVFYKNLEGKYLFGNQSFAQNYGLNAHEIVGKTDFDLLNIDLATEFGKDDQEVFQTGEPLKRETRIRASNRYFDLILTVKLPVKDDSGEVIGLVGIVRDISEFKEREKKLSTSLDDIASHAQQLNLLYKLAEKVSRSTSMQEAYIVAAQSAPLITRSNKCSLTLLNDNDGELQFFEIDRRQGLVELSIASIITESIVNSAIISKRAVIIDEKHAGHIKQLRSLFDKRLQSVLVVPLIAREKVIGTLNIHRITDAPFTRWEEQLVIQLASHLAITSENLRLLQKTKDQVEQLQISQLERDDLLQRLEEKQNFLESVLDSIPASVYVKDTKGRYQLVNQTYRENIIPNDTTKGSHIIQGVKDWIGKTDFEIIENQEYAQKFHAHDQALLDAPGLQKYEIDMQFADDSVRDVIFYKSTYTDPFGELGGIIGTILDITERKVAESKVLEREEELKNILENLPIAVAILTPSKFLYVNEETCNLLGGNMDQLLAMNPADLSYDQKDGNKLLKNFPDKVRQSNFDIYLKKLDGVKLPVNISMHAITLADQSVTLAVFYDLTTRRETEKLLIKAKEEAITTSKMKSEFLSNMSHELRTPMNGVLGMTSLLLNTELDGEQQEIVRTIRNSGDALLTIINEILDFSKIEAGKLEIEPIPHDLRGVVESSIDLVSTTALEKGLTLAYIIDPEVPAWIIQDETRIRQILANLLSNAVKFTSTGSIIINIVMAGPAKSLIQFSVTDTGIGIPENRIDRLFQSFTQVDASTTRRFGGTGLGLAISKRLAELLGGEMWVESELEVGSSFFFTIQAEACEIPKHQAEPKPLRLQTQETSFLLIESDPHYRAALASLLNLLSDKVTAVDSSQINEVQQQVNEADIVLADIETIPHLLTTRDLAKSSNLICTAPIGSKLEPSLAHIHVLYKPFKNSQLKEALENVLNGIKKQRQTGRLNRFNTKLAESIPLRILLAEDNVVNQKVALGILKRHGYSADLAANGLEAVIAAKTQRYDVILMDINMPEMDGVEATLTIRREIDPDQQPYIIALTANAFQEDKKRLLEDGLMDDFVSKPVSVDKLIDALSKVNMQS